MRALAWEFPSDPTLASADRQFFLGPAILVTPCLVQGATSVDGVFPGVGSGAVYYDWYNLTQIVAAPGQNVTIDAPLGHIPVYVRGGYVLPMQQPAMTTNQSRVTPWSILVALSETGAASGSLYLDDGESLVPEETLYVDLAATGSKLWASGRGTYVDMNALANVTVLGVQASPSTVSFNGISVAGWGYDAGSKVLTVPLGNVTGPGAWTQDWMLAW